MQRLFIFFKEAWYELKQVQWLTVPQMTASTVLVIVMVAIVAVFIMAVDFVIKFALTPFIASF